ncbi:MAG TPA: RsmE family RNA methyltransferase [Terriglobales bacterium]|jgi:16S rRNA (uracil1498-N3)-methyltransferase|nr:RsmE family RNA methyltransferase [Terriglobales bacterium]
MTRRRWIADEVSGDRAFLLGKNAEHLSRVLRARIGQQFEIATPSGVLLGEIVEIESERVVFSTRDLPQGDPRPQTAPIHLYLAVFKFDRFEWAIEKSTELGVSSIVPVIARRTDSHLVSAARKRVERWRRIAHEAAQQSRRDVVPEIPDPGKIEDVISRAPGKRIVLAETEREHRLAETIESASELSLAIGPEGGWTESDLSLFDKSEWLRASLGPTILRAETAAIAALVIAQSFQRSPS